MGTTSIGWAVVNEAETAKEQSSIIDLGVRIVPLTVEEQGNFEKGKAITTNADRTLKRSMRRNLFRYRLRRDALIRLLQEQGWITSQTVLAEKGNATIIAKTKCPQLQNETYRYWPSTAMTSQYICKTPVYPETVCTSNSIARVVDPEFLLSDTIYTSAFP